mmetsp:Transcript_23028/g.44932  ORF Transcript_23028/g.44932 Transcript_23028/m.44932 type:complete len:381 (-) Transcript_23028:454-1596(-)
MPSPTAWERAKSIASQVLDQHQQATGAFPETVAVTMWGLDAIKTRGESVGVALALVGAEPVKEATGRIVKYELMPLEKLGRPRVDVVCSMSGIFRDSFANVVDLLDDLFEQAALADEPSEMNYIKKHTLDLQQEGCERPTSRLFSNPAGDYGSMVNERVGTGDWKDGNELGSTWESRNAYSYGRKGERGSQRNDVLSKLLSTTDRIVQEIDSVEYGLTDIQEYYANTGALKKAAENNRNGRRVNVSIVETYGSKPKPKELESVLRLEYRSKLLNPKWAEAMISQGSGGAYEISTRVTALLGWSGTSDYADEWVYKGAVERYVLDESMAKRLKDANPEAFRNVARRFLEAHGRGFWQANDAELEALRDAYQEAEDRIEGVS